MHILWNYYYLWGPLFVDCQSFGGSLGRYYVGNWYVPLHCKTVHYFIILILRGYVEARVLVTYKVHKHRSHTNNIYCI